MYVTNLLDEGFNHVKTNYRIWVNFMVNFQERFLSLYESCIVFVASHWISNKEILTTLFLIKSTINYISLSFTYDYIRFLTVSFTSDLDQVIL